MHSILARQEMLCSCVVSVGGGIEMTNLGSGRISDPDFRFKRDLLKSPGLGESYMDECHKNEKSSYNVTIPRYASRLCCAKYNNVRTKSRLIAFLVVIGWVLPLHCLGSPLASLYCSSRTPHCHR